MKLLLSTLVLGVTRLGAAPLVESRIDWARFLGRSDLVWQRPPGAWTEAPMLGNATLGSMVFVQRGELVVQVFRDDLRDHRDDSYGWTAYSRPRLGVGSFHLKPVGKILGGEWRLELWNAELRGTLRTDRGEVRFRHYIHADQPIIATELWAERGEDGAAWRFEPLPAATTRGGYPTNDRERAEFATKYGDQYRTTLKPPTPNPPGRDERDGATSVHVQDFLVGGGYAVAWRQNPALAGHSLLLASIAHTFPQPTARATAVRALDAFSEASPEQRLESHRAWWHDYYPRSFVSLPDARLEALYWGTIYRYGCTARVGRSLVNTAGIWLQGGGWCYLTTDFNLQTAHWSLYAANRLEQAGEVLEQLHRNRDNLIRNVRPVAWQSDSAFLGLAAVDDLVAPRDADRRYERLVGNLPWALHDAWWQYRFSMDDALLRDKLYPLLRASINFYLHLLEPGADGKLHLPPTYSPESGESADCNFDLALLRWGCQALLQSAARLRLDDPLIPRWREVLDKLPDFWADEHGFGHGFNRTAPAGHRHGSHLLMVYPLFLANIDQPERRDVLRRTVEQFNSATGLPAMVATHGVPAASALGDGEQAWWMLRFQSADLFTNGLWFPSPCIESTLSAANGIQSMLLQSWGDTIRVFPAVPRAWADVAFSDLRTEGAFLVSASRRGGRTAWVRVKSLAGEPCRVRPGLASEPRVLASGRQPTLTRLGDGLYSLDLRRDEEVVLIDGDSNGLARLTAEPLPADPARTNSFGLNEAHERYYADFVSECLDHLVTDPPYLRGKAADLVTHHAGPEHLRELLRRCAAATSPAARGALENVAVAVARRLGKAAQPVLTESATDPALRATSERVRERAARPKG